MFYYTLSPNPQTHLNTKIWQKNFLWAVTSGIQIWMLCNSDPMKFFHKLYIQNFRIIYSDIPSKLETVHSVANQTTYLIVSILSHEAKDVSISPLVRYDWFESCDKAWYAKRQRLRFRPTVHTMRKEATNRLPTLKPLQNWSIRLSRYRHCGSIKQVMLSKLVMWSFQPLSCSALDNIALAVLLPYEAKQTLPTYFLYNCLPLSVYDRLELEKGTIIFLCMYGNGCYSCTQLWWSYALIEILNQMKQLAHIRVPTGLQAMPFSYCMLI